MLLEKTKIWPLLISVGLSSIGYKTIFFRQKIHHNLALKCHPHVLANGSEHKVCSWIFTHHRRKPLFKKHIRSYIIHWKNISLLSFSLSFSHLPLLLSFMWEAALGTQPFHINMRAGEMLPPCCRCWGPQRWKQWRMSPDMAGHVS